MVISEALQTYDLNIAIIIRWEWVSDLDEKLEKMIATITILSYVELKICNRYFFVELAIVITSWSLIWKQIKTCNLDYPNKMFLIFWILNQILKLNSNMHLMNIEDWLFGVKYYSVGFDTA